MLGNGLINTETFHEGKCLGEASLVKNHDYSLLLDAQGKVVSVPADGPNRLSLKALVGRNYLDCLSRFLCPIPTFLEAVGRGLGEMLRGDRDSFEHVHPCAQARGVQFRLRLTRLDGVGDPRILVTQERLSSEMIDAEHLRRARFALDHAAEAIFWSNAEGRLEYVNEAACRLFGYSQEQLRTLSIGDLDPGIPREASEARKRLSQFPESVRIQSLGRNSAGHVFPIEVSLCSLRFKGSQYQCAIVRDLTEQKRLEDQFRQAQKLEAVGRLAGGVAHDFNNLLTVINGYSDLLLCRPSLVESDRAAAREINDAGRRAAGLTRQLLAFSRRHLVQPAALDPNEVLGNMQKMLTRLIGEDIRVEIRKGKDVGQIKADLGQVEQAVMNLVVNARDAMPRGGTLTLETANAGETEVLKLPIAGLQPGPHVKVSISDTGFGMDAETLSHLYEPFFTTKAEGKGTGLGLSTVYGIMAQAGGHISCDSALGQGTTFTLFFPRCEEKPAAEHADPASPLSSGTERVLVVEDDAAVRLILRTVLQSRGYTVEVAASAQEVVQRDRPRKEVPDVVISDMIMPGMSGADFAKWVRTAWPGVPLLLVSGYTDRELETAVGGPETAFLQKPFQQAALVRKVRELLDRRTAKASPSVRLSQALGHRP